MEKLKSVIPEKLKQEISKSKPDELNSTSSSLLKFFQDLPLFHQVVRDLTDPEMKLCGKNKEASMEAKANGHLCFSRGDYRSALSFYSKALRIAPVDVEDMKKSLIATLYVNRASSLHKLGLFLESLRDCNRALTICPAYAKAWFRRGKANASLENYRDAITDLNVSLKMETSLSGKRQIQNELNMLLDKSRKSTRELEKPKDRSSDDELLQTKIECISTPTKGRGMNILSDITQGTLVHKEDPFAAIILKHCRETHCHFCFNELPEDTVPCSSCSIPLYCSVECQVQSGGHDFSIYVNKSGNLGTVSDDMEDYIRSVASSGTCVNSDDVAEHRHECGGVHWPAVLPSDVVLAGRVLVKHSQHQTYHGVDPNYQDILDLCQGYAKLSGETKLEFHVYSIILLCCLQQSHASKLPITSAVASQVIILLSQIRVNSMGIARVTFSDAKKPLDCDVTSSVEHVRVAQAIYSIGSLFNHSCQPNVHAYFLSRTVFIRATEYVAAGSELEISYGPQVGEWGCRERREFLQDRYSFACCCSGCAKLNFSDLVINAYRCVAPNCSGVVLDSCVAKYAKEKLKYQSSISNDEDIRKVCRNIFAQTASSKFFEPEHCLSCGSFRDLQASQQAIAEAEFYIKRLQDTIGSHEVPTNILIDASKSICTFRKILYKCNKRIAQVEDNVAQAFCLVGDLQAALSHCQTSIKILEKLYGKDHIVIGHELIKLATIQQSLGHEGATDTTSRLVTIFSRYYGPHAGIMLPHLPFIG